MSDDDDVNASDEPVSAADAEEAKCLVCGHPRSRHAEWHPTFVAATSANSVRIGRRRQVRRSPRLAAKGTYRELLV